MCKLCENGVNTEKTVCNSTMPWPWYQKRQVSGVASNLTGRRIQSCHSESGKTSPLLRLDSTGEISSDTEQGVLYQNPTMEFTNQDPRMTSMENAQKYPYSHAADNQLHWFRYGNQFQQAYKMEFSPYTSAYTMPQQNFVNPTWAAVPQVYDQTGFGHQGLGSAGGTWVWYNTPQQPQGLSLVYTVMGNQPVLCQDAAEAFPVWTTTASSSQVNRDYSYPKSRMNPNAKPFTPQSMQKRQAANDNQPANAIADERQEMEEKCPENMTTGISDREESGLVVKECPEKSAAVVSVTSESASNGDSGINNCDTADQLELSDVTVDESNGLLSDTIPTGADEKSKIDSIVKGETLESSVAYRSDRDEPCPEASGKIHIEANPEELGFTAVVSLSSGSSGNDQRQINVGRNTYILSRPRLKKKCKPSLQDRKRRKRRTRNDATGSNASDDTKNCTGKEHTTGSMTFIVGSASSEDDSDDERGIHRNSIVINPLQCDSESGGDSDWDEVDGIASAADFFTDQMCELLQPFMLSVLTVPCSSTLPKSASAPLLNHSLEAVNRRWSEVYNICSTDVVKSGAKQKKVHFAHEEGDNQPLQTFHPVEEYSRRGPWEQYAADRCRFKSRVADLRAVIDPVLRKSHREKIFRKRFTDVS